MPTYMVLKLNKETGATELVQTTQEEYESTHPDYRSILADGNPGNVPLYESLGALSEWVDYESKVVEVAADEIDDPEIARAAEIQSEEMADAAKALEDAADAAAKTAAESFVDSGVAADDKAGEASPEGDAVGGNPITAREARHEELVARLRVKVAEDPEGIWSELLEVVTEGNPINFDDPWRVTLIGTDEGGDYRITHSFATEELAEAFATRARSVDTVTKASAYAVVTEGNPVNDESYDQVYDDAFTWAKDGKKVSDWEAGEFAGYVTEETDGMTPFSDVWPKWIKMRKDSGEVIDGNPLSYQPRRVGAKPGTAFGDPAYPTAKEYAEKVERVNEPYSDEFAAWFADRNPGDLDPGNSDFNRWANKAYPDGIAAVTEGNPINRDAFTGPGSDGAMRDWADSQNAEVWGSEFTSLSLNQRLAVTADLLDSDRTAGEIAKDVGKGNLESYSKSLVESYKRNPHIVAGKAVRDGNPVDTAPDANHWYTKKRGSK